MLQKNNGNTGLTPLKKFYSQQFSSNNLNRDQTELQRVAKSLQVDVCHVTIVWRAFWIAYVIRYSQLYCWYYHIHLILLGGMIRPC